MIKTILCACLFVFGLLLAGCEADKYWPWAQLVGGLIFASILLVIRREE